MYNSLFEILEEKKFDFKKKKPQRKTFDEQRMQNK